ncbi:signal peptidase I [Streptomyces sp. NBC_01233]|uniref:signal peptidase I n=1 Tax=Streptomyces sp. NBC_01233 TaxID=2903787 RepID=UPI002E10836C|nr:signal peptidase I [Streptomyces sp. NBC_01233]
MGVKTVLAALVTIGVFFAPGGYDAQRMGDDFMAPRSPRGTDVWYELSGEERIHRGDVAVVSDPEGVDGIGIGGRVLAVAGDRLSYASGDPALTLNGKPLAEPYLAPGSPPSAVPFDVRVPEGRVLVMGDNRGLSHDADYLAGQGHGTLPTGDIRGKLVPKPTWLLLAAIALALGALFALAGTVVGISFLTARRRARASAPATLGQH